jgi:hypothetical protein
VVKKGLISPDKKIERENEDAELTSFRMLSTALLYFSQNNFILS